MNQVVNQDVAPAVLQSSLPIAPRALWHVLVAWGAVEGTDSIEMFQKSGSCVDFLVPPVFMFSS